MPRSIFKPFLLIPITAILAILPLLVKGGSCGHDMVFHVQGWYDAAAQLRHFRYPHWSYTSAWNAGEPRFIFYPPLSWLLGAVLTLMLPPQAAVSAFIFLTLAIAGLTMYRLAAHFATPTAALIAAVLYLSNPYMLFNAFERSAFAELLAAAWVPLLLLAVLRHRPTVPAIAVPLALLWLTNAPAAVMASYTLALLAALRVVTALVLALRRRNAFKSSLLPTSHFLLPAPLTLTYLSGTLLGLALPAFFLIPAAYERRYIQVALAVIPNMRIQDNFLFTQTADPGHNGVNHQISLLALTLLILTIATVTTRLALYLRSSKGSVIARDASHSSSNPASPVTLSAVSPDFMRESQQKDLPPIQAPAVGMAVLTATLVFLFLPISLPIWNHIPELSFLQFPWRLLTIVSAVLAFSIALLLHRTPPAKPKPATRYFISNLYSLFSISLALILGFLAFNLYSQFCQPNDHPAAIAQNLLSHHGFPPTDEYTPNTATTTPPRSEDPDSDVLRTDNPSYWLISPTANPNTPAPNTIPTAAELDPNLQTDDTPVPLNKSIAYSAPTHLTLNLSTPQILVLNLRDYRDWQITDTTPTATTSPNHLQRDDGLLTVPLPVGPNTIDIHWRTTPDQQLGLALSILALLALLFLSLSPSSKQPSSSDH